MKQILYSAFVAILLFACGEKATYRQTNTFNLQKDALTDTEPIKLIYMGARVEGNNEHYTQVIAVSQKTGDTVNILCNHDIHFTKPDGDKIFNYLDENNIVNKIDQLKPGQNIKELDNIKPKKFLPKVAIDPKFNAFSNNGYPTVIGTIGTFTKNTPQN